MFFIGFLVPPCRNDDEQSFGFEEFCSKKDEIADFSPGCSNQFVGNYPHPADERLFYLNCFGNERSSVTIPCGYESPFQKWKRSIAN